MNQLADKLYKNSNLSDKELCHLLETDENDERLIFLADKKRREIYGEKVFVRGLIEFTNYCKNDCYYCGIRKDNKNCLRYRLTKDEILSCCKEGYELGFRTFVLQGGEDPFFTDEIMCDIIGSIHSRFKDCAITLSIGEKSAESYKKYFDAGAERYLLRHETADENHYRKLHPFEMSLENRKKCLYTLKKIGYITGAGFMIGSPFQTTQNIISDLRFMQELKPHMIGAGPFIPHKETEFAAFESGKLDLCIRITAVLRLMFPYTLIPATTALGTINPLGREKGLKAGANVVMPNLSPVRVRKMYELYDNKICTGEESAQCIKCLENRVKSAGYHIVTDRGDPVYVEEGVLKVTGKRK